MSPQDKSTLKRGDIYFVAIGKTPGHEQRGHRPAVIIQNNLGNKHSPTIIIALITSKQKRMYLPTHVTVTISGRTSVVMLEQIMTIDQRKLIYKLGALSKSEMRLVDHALSISVGLEAPSKAKKIRTY